MCSMRHTKTIQMGNFGLNPWSATLTAAAFGILSACDADLGERVTPPSRSFGEVIYQEVCERVAFTSELEQWQNGQRPFIDASGVAYRPMCNVAAAPPSSAAPIMHSVAAERPTIVTEVNHAIPEALLDPLDQALRNMLPALDGPAGQKMLLGASDVLLRMGADPQVVGSLGRLGLREGFVPRGSGGNAVRGFLNLANLYTTANAVLPVLWPSADGVDDAPGRAEKQALFAALHYEWGTLVAVNNPNAADRTLNLARRFLFTKNAELSTLPPGQGVWAVLRDFRGAAQISTPDGVLPPQFVDADGDGLADLDENGHFLKNGGGLLADVSPFPLLDGSRTDNAIARDADGRALFGAGGPTLYRYLNLDDTVLAALLRDVPTLLDTKRDIPLRLARGVKHLLGPRLMLQRDYSSQGHMLGSLNYRGFDKAQSPFLDLLYSYLQLLGYTDDGNASGTELVRLLRGADLLLRDQESAFARSLYAAAQAFDEAKKPEYANAKLDEHSTLYDDLVPVLVRMLRVPGLVDAVLASLQTSEAAALGPLIAKLATTSDYVRMSQSQLNWQEPGAVVGSIGRPINRALPNSDVDMDDSNPANNRSTLQRLLHLVHDANGLAFCNKDQATVGVTIGSVTIPFVGPAAPCELYKIDDLSLYFVLSFADDSVKQNIPYANFLNALINGTLHTGAVAVQAIGLLDNLLGIPGFSELPKPQELSRLLLQNSDTRSSMFKTTLDDGPCENPARPGTMCCNQSHSWRDVHNGVLFALELDVNGNPDTPSTPRYSFYRAFRPVVNAFASFEECFEYDVFGQCSKTRTAAKILVDLLSVLHRHWPTVESKFYGHDYEAQSKKSGVSRYEPLIAKLLGQGDLWPSSLALAQVLLTTRVPDGANLALSTLIHKFAKWFFDPQAGRIGGNLAYRDGRKRAVRNDGAPTFAATGDLIIKDVISPAAQGLPTPYDLLADAYQKKRARLALMPDIAADWNAAVSNLADIYLTAKPSAGSYKFQNPRIRSVERALLDFLQARVQNHAASADFLPWVQNDLYSSIATSLTGPIGASSLDLLDRLRSSANAGPKLLQLFSDFLADPGPQSSEAPRFWSSLSFVADSLQLLLDDADLLPLLQKASLALDPQNGALDGAMTVLRRGLPADAEQVLLRIGQNLFKPDDGGGYPAFWLMNAIFEINRHDAGMPNVMGSALRTVDYQWIVQVVGYFLADHKRGGARLLDIVQSRHMPH